MFVKCIVGIDMLWAVFYSWSRVSNRKEGRIHATLWIHYNFGKRL